MRRSPRNLRIACDHKGLTHFGGIYFFHEFLQVLQIRRFLTQNLDYPRRNQRYSLAQMILALVYPLVLGLDRLETASFLRSNGTFQYLTGLQSFPDPQTLRRFLLQAPDSFLRVRGGGPGYQNGGPPFANHSLRLSLSSDHLRTVLAVKGSLRRAQQRRALDGSGPF